MKEKSRFVRPHQGHTGLQECKCSCCNVTTPYSLLKFRHSSTIVHGNSLCPLRQPQFCHLIFSGVLYSYKKFYFEKEVVAHT